MQIKLYDWIYLNHTWTSSVLPTFISQGVFCMLNYLRLYKNFEEANLYLEFLKFVVQMVATMSLGAGRAYQ